MRKAVGDSAIIIDNGALLNYKITDVLLLEFLILDQYYLVLVWKVEGSSFV